MVVISNGRTITLTVRVRKDFYFEKVFRVTTMSKFKSINGGKHFATNVKFIVPRFCWKFLIYIKILTMRSSCKLFPFLSPLTFNSFFWVILVISETVKVLMTVDSWRVMLDLAKSSAKWLPTIPACALTQIKAISTVSLSMSATKFMTSPIMLVLQEEVSEVNEIRNLFNIKKIYLTQN